MPQFAENEAVEVAREEGGIDSKATTPASARLTDKSDKVHTPQSRHNFSELANLVKKKWYANETLTPSLPKPKPKPNPQLSLSVSTNESSSPWQSKSPLLLVSTNDVQPARSVLSPLAEPFSHNSPKANSSEDSPPNKSPWHWSIQPYELWSQATAKTQERVESDSDDNKTIPFPPYVEPVVPGYDFMTGTATDTGPPPTQPDQPSFFARVTAPAIQVAAPKLQVTASALQGTAATTLKPSTTHAPDDHMGLLGNSRRNSRRNSRSQDAISHPPVGAVQPNVLGLDDHALRTKIGQTSTKSLELEALTMTIKELTKSLERVARERDSALKIVHQVSDDLMDAQNAVLIQEGEILEFKRMLVAEQLKGEGLQEEIEHRQRDFQERFGKLQEEHTKKVGECDMQREELMEQDKRIMEAEQRMVLASRKIDVLNGAAHLVVPDKQTILPYEVVSCFECYANSRECDNQTRCRSCVESKSKCARWRCGVYHILGECPSAPCKLPHSMEGWVVVHQRPEW